jgi:hypothetical protein
MSGLYGIKRSSEGISVCGAQAIETVECLYNPMTAVDFGAQPIRISEGGKLFSVRIFTTGHKPFVYKELDEISKKSIRGNR